MSTLHRNPHLAAMGKTYREGGGRVAVYLTAAEWREIETAVLARMEEESSCENL